MDATYDALCRHGYADLSIQKIADEFDGGKSLIYYHYDDKQELMVSFLECMKQRIESDPEDISELPPKQRLDELLERAMAVEDSEMWNLRRALMEMRAQTPHNEEFSDKLQSIDGILLQQFKEIFRELEVEDPERRAELLISTVDGYMSRKISYDSQEGLEEMKDDIKQLYL